MLACKNFAKVNLCIILIALIKISFIFIILHFWVIPITFINMSFTFMILNYYIGRDGALRFLPPSPEDSQAAHLQQHHQVAETCLKAQI